MNLVNYLSTGSPDAIHQRVSPHFLFGYSTTRKPISSDGWSNLRLWSYWKVKRTRCQTGNLWISWCEESNNQFCIYSLLYTIWTLKIDALQRKFSLDTVIFGFHFIFLEYVCMFTYFTGVPQRQFDLSYTVQHFVWQVCPATSKYQHECHGYSFKSVMLLYKNSLTTFNPTVTKRSLVLNQNAAFVYRSSCCTFDWRRKKVLGATLVLRTCACLSGELAEACEEWSNKPLLPYPIMIDAWLLHLLSICFFIYPLVDVRWCWWILIFQDICTLSGLNLRKSTASVIVNQSTPRNGIVESSDYFVVSSAWLFQIRVGNTPKVSKSDFVILLL